jgi:hypothetical protein
LKQSCYEISATTGAIVRKLIEFALSQEVRSFKVATNRPYFPKLILSGEVYTLQPERDEGHALKLYTVGETLRDAIEDRMSKLLTAIHDEDKYSIDINFLNEW